MARKIGTGRISRTVAALVVVVLAIGGASLVSVAGAASKANEAKVSAATMSWGVSPYVLTANPATASVSEVHTATAPATFAAATGWTFTDGAGKYNTKTGATTVSFPGSLEFGNTTRGNYSLRFANPTVVLDKARTGTLTAEVSVRQPGATAYDAASKVVVLDLTNATQTKTKKHVTVKVSPAVFSPTLVSAVGTTLAPHFQATGSSNDANKPPAPITLDFNYKAK